MRRQTILLTVLINAGLLLVLFATAIHPGESKKRLAASAAPEAPTPIVYHPPSPPVREIPPPPPVFEAPIARVEPPKPAPERAVVEKPLPAVERPTDAKLVEVTVKKGDSLDRIARGNGTTVDALMKANALTNTRLQIGQILKVPVGEPKPVQVQPAAQTDSGTYYTVRSGDNPWLIATKSRIPLEELLKLNGLNEESARKLKPGDKLRIQ
ncbi:MAG: LysM peptidoglycan-binding domain-containing protein [Parachlamydiales bacterium]